MSGTHQSDKTAAITGMIVTALALFLMAFTIVKLTNQKYAGESKAEATK